MNPDRDGLTYPNQMEPRQLLFKLTKESFTVRGTPADWDDSDGTRRPARLWLDEQEVSRHNEILGPDWESNWSWGRTYVERDEYNNASTAEVIAGYFITDLELVGLLRPLINETYLEALDPDAPFIITVNILDFMLEYGAAIEAARQEQQRRQQQRQLKQQGVSVEGALALSSLAAGANQPHYDSDVEPQEWWLKQTYGPAASTHWLEFSTGHPTLSGRCRVDIFPAYALVVLTDLGIGAVQHSIEGIVEQVCRRLDMNSQSMRLFQRYRHDPELIDEVSYVAPFWGHTIDNPKWNSVSTARFEAVIDEAVQYGTNSRSWLRDLFLLAWRIYQRSSRNEGIRRTLSRSTPSLPTLIFGRKR